jgi:uncharacterized repeat protein (TIGR03847 family)
MTASFELNETEWISVGTVGLPGQRTFYLQARQGDRLVTLKLEKQQVAALSQLLGGLLSDLPAASDVPSVEQLALVEPVLAEWTVGSMQLAYDQQTDRIVLLAEEIDTAAEPEPEAEAEAEPDDEPDAETGAIGRMAITRAQAAALVYRGEELVTAGRPPCPLCGHPLDPTGHSCPRTNGHRPPAP